VYARKVKDQTLDFGHRGWLYEESFLFYDYQTDSLWVQATGQAVSGNFKGTTLDRIPATQTTWSEWRQLYPETLVLNRAKQKNTRYWRDSYDLYYATGKGIKYQRHKPLSFGLGVITPSGKKLYPFEELEKRPVLQDQIGAERVLIVFHPNTRTAVAWTPSLKNQKLDFELSKTEKTDLTITDKQTGSTWSGLTGLCTTGPSKGGQLQQLTTTQFVAENWPLHYPDAPIFQAKMPK
jgi:hypothetical protein